MRYKFDRQMPLGRLIMNFYIDGTSISTLLNAVITQDFFCKAATLTLYCKFLMEWKNKGQSEDITKFSMLFWKYICQ